jgi:hypothetical protein
MEPFTVFPAICALFLSRTSLVSSASSFPALLCTTFCNSSTSVDLREPSNRQLGQSAAPVRGVQRLSEPPGRSECLPPTTTPGTGGPRPRRFGPERHDRGTRRGQHAPGDWSSNAVARHPAPARPRRLGACSTPSATSPWPSTTSRYLGVHVFSSAPSYRPTASGIPIQSGLAFWPKPRQPLGRFHAAAGVCSVIRGSPDRQMVERRAWPARWGGVLREDGAGSAPRRSHDRTGPSWC